MGTAVKLRRRRTVQQLLATIDPDEVLAAASDPARMREAHAVHHALGGPAKWRPLTLFGEATASTKSVDTGKRGTVEHIHYMLPHTEAGGCNYCTDSTPGCRNACLINSGRLPMVWPQLAARNRFHEADPVGYWAKLYQECDMIERRAKAGRYRPLARLDGTTDMWADQSPVGRMLIESHKWIRFGDYTKASPERRPAPTLPNYSLARSVWTDRHSIGDIVALWADGHHVSVVVDDYEPLRRLPMTVDASKGDDWILRKRPTIGCLSAKGSTITDGDQYNATDLAGHLAGK